MDAKAAFMCAVIYTGCSAYLHVIHILISPQEIPAIFFQAYLLCWGAEHSRGWRKGAISALEVLRYVSLAGKDRPLLFRCSSVTVRNVVQELNTISLKSLLTFYNNVSVNPLTSVDPVKAILSMPTWDAMAAPTIGPNPGKILTTPGGKPACQNRKEWREAWFMKLTEHVKPGMCW